MYTSNMIILNSWLLFISIALFLKIAISENVGNDTVNALSDDNEGRVLSRRKRFITFPDGSSFQLVFCCQTAALIPIGDIFLFGNTAALAWNLPSDPQLFNTLKEYEKPLRRIDTVNYFDETGKIVARVPYHRRPIINPAFAKRSIDDKMTFKEKLKIKIDRKRMHEKQVKRDYLKAQHMDRSSVEFHRSNRVELYVKIEKLMTALGRDGRQCVLYKLCEAAQTSPAGEGRQGTFLQEFLRAVFTLPKGEEFEYEEHKGYDKAHSETDDCITRYPGCDEFEATIM